MPDVHTQPRHAAATTRCQRRRRGARGSSKKRDLGAVSQALRSVSACSQHATPGRVKARGLVGVYAHLSEAVRTRRRGCPGATSLALSTLRLTTLAKTQGGASQRLSVLAGPMFLCCCCCCVGQAKVNGATKPFSSRLGTAVAWQLLQCKWENTAQLYSDAFGASQHPAPSCCAAAFK